MNRDGSLDWYSPKMRRRAAPVRTSFARGARHADITEPAFFFELLWSSDERECGNSPSSRPARAPPWETRGPSALCSVIIQTRAFCVPDSSSTSDSSDRRSTNPPSEGSGSRPSYLARGRHELREVFDARLGVFAPVLAQILEVAALVEHLADRDRHRLLPGDVGQPDDQVAEGRQRRGCASGKRARPRGPRTMRVHSELAASARLPAPRSAAADQPTVRHRTRCSR